MADESQNDVKEEGQVESSDASSVPVQEKQPSNSFVDPEEETQAEDTNEEDVDDSDDSDEESESASKTIPYPKFQKRNKQYQEAKAKVEELEAYRQTTETLLDVIRGDEELTKQVLAKLNANPEAGAVAPPAVEQEANISAGLSPEDREALEDLRATQRAKEYKAFAEFEAKYAIKDDATRKLIGQELGIVKADPRLKAKPFREKLELAYKMHLLKNGQLDGTLKEEAMIDSVINNSAVGTVNTAKSSGYSEASYTEEQIAFAKKMGVDLD